MGRMRKLVLLLALALLPFGTPARADGEIGRLVTAADKARLERFDATRREAVAEAAKGDPVAWEAFAPRLAKPSLSFAGWDMTGDWRCRVTKLGGVLPIVTYGWFRCRVTDDGSGWRLEKLDGSQRTAGRFFTESDNRLTYLGSQFVAGETAKPYGAGAPSDQVGYTFRTGSAEWRIELPAPAFESKLDVIEFSR